MKNGNVDDFIYSLYDDSACVRYKGRYIVFSRLRHNLCAGTYTVSVEKYHYTKRALLIFWVWFTVMNRMIRKTA